ncbi:hypothetical protein BCON_0016g00820 [Botryotinia convoluta]|uniref:Uncharacterized protein n=1 Tax=Botryotinia convoluta TaxID=54673 RepID=A0A4Z1IMX5_9HELO|nr:hypothetical protein BCON_0016g00820 [Botryotinia convoluta]
MMFDSNVHIISATPKLSVMAPASTSGLRGCITACAAQKVAYSPGHPSMLIAWCKSLGANRIKHTRLQIAMQSKYLDDITQNV